MFTFGSLFTGLGGIDLGLERAGMVCKWQVEIDDHARRILTKHWPNVPKFRDVREVGRRNLERVDVLCGGFPCQDVSAANPTGEGLEGSRSGLWYEFDRIICELRPRYVLVENVSNLLNRGISDVLGCLAEIGYDAEWKCLRASDFGAAHGRERLFIAAYPVRQGLPLRGEAGEKPEDARIFKARPGPAERVAIAGMEHSSADFWGGKVHGVPGRVDRIRGLGNAVVPQVAEWVGRMIVAANARETGTSA